MIEIRFLARAGQGAKSAAQIVAEAAMKEGKEIQAFPEYGPERTGAPISSYCRIDTKPIDIHEPILSPSVLIIFDPSLIEPCLKIESLNPDCVIIINSNKDAKFFLPKFKGFKGHLFTIPATHIALDELKHDKPNSALIGALVKTTKVVTMTSVKKRYVDHFLRKLGRKGLQANYKCLERGFKDVKKG